MNFFEAQDRTRRNTRRLVLLYVLATVIIVALVTAVVAVLSSQWLQPSSLPLGAAWLEQNAAMLGTSALGTTGFIGLASAYKIARLSSGGARVALDLGGSVVASDVTDPLRRRLRNVVEEMSIASGVPRPGYFRARGGVRDQCVRGGIQPRRCRRCGGHEARWRTLDRDELQGVIAHEFSHILNGDMRLNIRLMGVLFGILAIGVIGRMMLRSSRHSSSRSSNGRGGASAGVLIGLALMIIGYVGVFMGRLIKAGVSRQREFLADASAVQFTRQTRGIAGALRKIAGYSAGSRAARRRCRRGEPHAVRRRTTRVLPVCWQRTRPLKNVFRPSTRRSRRMRSNAMTSARSIVPFNINEIGEPVAAMAAFGERQTIEPGDWLDRTGNLSDEAILFACSLRRSVPELLRSAAHSRDLSPLLALALSLDGDEAERNRQISFLGSKLGELRARRVADLNEEYRELGPCYRLALLDMAFPALKERPAAQLDFLVELVDELIELDGYTDLAEYCFARVLKSQLHDARRPRATLAGMAKLDGNDRTLEAARTLLGVFAWRSHDSETDSVAAYGAGVALLPRRRGRGVATDSLAAPGNWIDEMDDALATLNELSAVAKRQVLDALITVARYDHGVTLAEAEMLRAIASVLQCPLPPLIPQSD